MQLLDKENPVPMVTPEIFDEGMKKTTLRASRELGHPDTLILHFQPPNCETRNFYGCEPASLWSFVPAAPAN